MQHMHAVNGPQHCCAFRSPARLPSEQADVDKEVLKQQSHEGRKAELDKLVETWQERGLDRDLAQRVAVTLTEKDVVRAHARVRAWVFLSQPL